MDATLTGTAVRRGGRLQEWLLRYAPAEVFALIGALGGAFAVSHLGYPAVTAYAAAIGEGVLFYSAIMIRDLRSNRQRGLARRPLSHTLRNLSLEFGPAEVLDSLVVRPLAMYVGPILVGSLTAGVILGKIAADVVFYTLAIVGYEFGKKLSVGRAEPGGLATMLTDEPMPEQATPEPPTAEAETAEVQTAEAETADNSTPEPPTAPMAAVGWASAEEIRPTPVVGWFPGEAATANSNRITALSPRRQSWRARSGRPG
jgi:hypothetical protein